jgi:hypothetical protein
MKSIARRIAKLEVALSPHPQSEHWRSSQWRSRTLFHGPLHVRFGKLRRLPESYQGERHVVIAERLPQKNGQEWVEFAEVPGPAPSLPPQDPAFPRYLDVVFVAPYPVASMPMMRADISTAE